MGRWGGRGGEVMALSLLTVSKMVAPPHRDCPVAITTLTGARIMHPKTVSSASDCVRLSRTPGMVLLAHDLQKIVSALAKHLRKAVRIPVGHK
jgi:hypothetical protein